MQKECGLIVERKQRETHCPPPSQLEINLYDANACKQRQTDVVSF